MNIRTMFKVVFSLALLAFLLYRVDMVQIVQTLSTLSISVCALVLTLHFIALSINVVKWKLFLPEQSFSQLLRFTFIDSFYSVVLPGQVSGEVAKAFRLGKRAGNMKKVAVSVWLDKITGLVGLLIVMSIGLFLSSKNIPPSLYYLTLLFFAACTAGVVLFRLTWAEVFLKKTTTFLERRKCKRLAVFSKQVYLAVKEFEVHPLAVFVNIFLGMLYQIVAIMITVVLANAFSITVPIYDWMWIFGVISIIQIAPISIAGLGVREASFVGILSLFAVPASSALALSLSIFGIQVFYALVGALVEVHYTVKG